ncbi:hypothetical protein E2C01_087697 [Portunus trituberculatus]|uniref:Uncharacterized protein n=1 Tax=Portunus trituberculatus TaxID=210409 RepID=A0A5B7J7A5_PORTR|nr:hypothetical protein [Portunus trituberculatus]
MNRSRKKRRRLGSRILTNAFMLMSGVSVCVSRYGAALYIYTWAATLTPGGPQEPTSVTTFTHHPPDPPPPH